MARWYTAMRAVGWRSRLVIAAAALAVVLVAAVPVALFTGLVMILIGHAAGGLALFGASVLAAVAGVTIAAKVGVRHVRSLIRQAMDPLSPDNGTEGSRTTDSRAPGPRVVRLSEGEYRIT